MIGLRNSFRSLAAASVLALFAGCAVAPLPREEAVGVRPAVPALALNTDVTQATIADTICRPGYTALVRPSTTYTNGVKKKLLDEANIPAGNADRYELDHRVPLALGGHPRHLENLVLQSWNSEEGAKKKDRLERKLQLLVCAGSVPLSRARAAIWFDWLGAYRMYIGSP